MLDGVPTSRLFWRWRDSVMRRGIFSANPPPRGDYILSSTGLTWNVRCATGNGSVMTVADGALDKKSALATLLSMAEADKADAWETAGIGAFRLVKGYRSSP